MWGAALIGFFAGLAMSCGSDDSFDYDDDYYPGHLIEISDKGYYNKLFKRDLICEAKALLKFDEKFCNGRLGFNFYFAREKAIPEMFTSPNSYRILKSYKDEYTMCEHVFNDNKNKNGVITWGKKYWSPSQYFLSEGHKKLSLYNVDEHFDNLFQIEAAAAKVVDFIEANPR